MKFGLRMEFALVPSDVSSATPTFFCVFQAQTMAATQVWAYANGEPTIMSSKSGSTETETKKTGSVSVKRHSGPSVWSKKQA